MTFLLKGDVLIVSQGLDSREVQQFVCGVAVICKGRPEQKLRLLFMGYDTDKDQRLCLGQKWTKKTVGDEDRLGSGP